MKYLAKIFNYELFADSDVIYLLVAFFLVAL